MKSNAISITAILLLLALMDFIWLATAVNRFYAPLLGHLLQKSVKMVPAIVFYFLYAIGIQIFIVGPGLKNHSSYTSLFCLGILFGLVAYGTYNLTNQAVLKDWPPIVTIVDMAWGGLLTGSVSTLAVFFTRILA